MGRVFKALFLSYNHHFYGENLSGNSGSKMPILQPNKSGEKAW
ncbi:protein of unknown function [Xenorhabdus poinarii G6]|uniref:Uncharacterized protein n=1 Tax=Xenorhabdus poinarii G6 TaxID=1354304 RepID=A0A068R8I7_9GAMM|nr:protein of unknown function [Xenorhabdus poinarii G6]